MKGEHLVDGTHHFGALDDQGELEQPLDLGRRPADLADDGRRRHLNVVEVDLTEPADQVEAFERGHRNPGSVAGTRNWVRPSPVREVTRK